MKTIVTVIGKHCVATFRAVGMEARWTKHSGTPFIAVRDPQSRLEHQRTKWWTVDAPMWDRMQNIGLREGFNQTTLLGDIFSIPSR